MNLLPNLPRLSTVVNMMMNASSDGHMYEYLVNPISLIIILLVTEARLPSLDLAFGYRAQSHVPWRRSYLRRYSRPRRSNA